MAKEVLNKIVEIEAKARKIVDDARLAAAHIESESRKKAKALEEESLTKQKEQRIQLINKAKASARARIKVISDELTTSAKAIEKKAKPAIKKAKDLVLKEMKKSLCL